MAEYSIRELSNRYGIPASTLRYYEELGLLTNVIHTDKNQRIYTEEHIAKLDAIQCFKQTGLSLGKIQEFFEYGKDLPKNIDAVVSLMEEHEVSIRKQMEELQEGLSHIQHKVRYYTGIQKAIQQNTPWPSWEDCEEPDEIQSNLEHERRQRKKLAAQTDELSGA